MTALKPWYGVVTPHEDIRLGRLNESVFAANLWAVVQKTDPGLYGQTGPEVPDVYHDAEAFFTKTYLTAGLENVLRKAARALSEEADAGDRILSLQTSFGGGKTHALVALWHLAKHTDVIRTSPACVEVRRALGDRLPERVKAVAVFTNQTCDATQGRATPLGVHTRTLWGELALQLGGVELYREIEANDQARTVPQGLFVKILQRAAPCLILLDELADYCVGASAVPVSESNLADQTISFAQQLTEAVNQVRGVAVIATLPASHMEVASSERGQEILGALERRFGRMSSDLRPVADEEIYEVVRRRLFESLGDPREHEQVADAYFKMYQQHPNEIPPEAGRVAYRDRLLQAYPFHPSLIDAFFLRWGSHSEFQRTRGVLRLLASIVGDLWQRRNTETQSQPLIQPAHIHWTIDALHAALTRLWGASYETVVAADVIGDKANALLLDEERGGEYVREKIAQGLAASILLGSFGGQGERAGLSTKELKLCASRPELNWGYADGALLEMENRAFYLRYPSAGNLGKRYWFDTRPTLNNLIVRYRQQFSNQDYTSEILEALDEKKVNGLKTSTASWRVVVNPEADLPEQRSLTLLVLPPAAAYSENGSQTRLVATPAEQRILDLSRKCGTRDRLYRNTLLFLLPSTRGLNRLRSAFGEVAALEAVQRDYGGQLDGEQVQELTGRLEKARKAVNEALSGAYTYIARVEGEKVVIVPISDVKPSFSEQLQAAWKQVVEDEEWVLRKVGIVTLQNVGLAPAEGGLRVKDAIEAFLRYTDKPLIASRDAVLLGLQQACEERVIGIARGVNLNNLQKKWCGETVTLDPNEEGLWIIPPFEPEQVVPATTTVDTPTGSGGIQSGAIPGETIPEQDRPGVDQSTTTTDRGKLVERIQIKGNISLDNWAEVFRCFIAPAVRMNLKRLRLGINFDLETQAGQGLDENDPALKAMKEAARQLGVELEDE